MFKRIPLTCNINGREVQAEVEPYKTLLDFLREDLRLTGTKRSCDVQVCGACTVLVGGLAVSSCTYLAFEVRGKQVLTIEGLAQNNKLHPIQQAFIDRSGFQCGFCTPGMIMAAKSLLDTIPDPNEEEIKSYMKGNLCRCTGYRSILEAIQEAAHRMKPTTECSLGGKGTQEQ
jgi:aerobic-type carbon monoxide dehydrogenase small subunit (CoxS/CutS family)